MLAALETSSAAGDGIEELVISAQVKLLFFDFDWIAAMRKCFSDFQQLLRGDGEEADLIEKIQQPGFAGNKLGRGAIGVPHLQGPANELIASGTFHAVDAHVRPANADSVFR